MDKQNKHLTIIVPVSLHKSTKIAASHKGMTMTAFIIEMLNKEVGETVAELQKQRA